MALTSHLKLVIVFDQFQKATTFLARFANCSVNAPIPGPISIAPLSEPISA